MAVSAGFGVGGTGVSRLLLNHEGQNQAYSGVGRYANKCTATFLKPTPGEIAPASPAYVLTAGHCAALSGKDDVLIDAAGNGGAAFNYFTDTRDRQVSYRVKRVRWSSMKGTDLAVLELDATYGELIRAGLHPLELSAGPPAASEAITVVGVPAEHVRASEVFLRSVECTQNGAVDLRESVWTFRGFYRNDCSDMFGGSSGSPVLSGSTGKVIGVLNTTTIGVTRFGPGFDCALNQPCEITAKGSRSIPNTSYAAPVSALVGCFSEKGVFDLTRADCRLDRGTSR